MQVSQWHEMYSHDLEVMSSNAGQVKLGVRSTSVLSCTWTKNIKQKYANVHIDVFSSVLFMHKNANAAVTNPLCNA